MNNYVVVWDPQDRYWEGSLVSEMVANQIAGRGGVALPVDPALFQVSGVGGYFRRGWGAGWPMDHGVPKMFCPMSIYMTPEHRVLHWVARLVPDEKFNVKEPIPGPSTLSVMSYAARANSYSSPLSNTGAKPLRELGVVDANGGWTARGSATTNPGVEGAYAFALYGAAPGVRVAWGALSVTK